jgi:hypothetical protein
MGTLRDRLNAMHVHVSLPNGQIMAELHGKSRVHVTFAPGSYHQYDESSLETDLARLAALLWAARTRFTTRS